MAKIRMGFVSNSSSSSFVLVKNMLTEDEIAKFKAFVRLHNDSASEGYIEESKSAFFGAIDNHIENPLPDSVINAIEYGSN